MPPPKAVLCPICGKKYFKASLPIHLKACKKKYDSTHSECKNCGMMVANDEWSDHRSFCKEMVKRRVANGGTGKIFITAAPTEYPDEDLKGVDPRVPCDFCGRKFNPDRVNKHMRICHKIKSKATKKRRKVWDGAKKRIEGTDFAAFENRRSSTPELVKEWKKHGRRWRKEREQFRSCYGGEDEKEDNLRGQIKSLQRPKHEPGTVGNVIPSDCDYKLPENHQPKFVAPKRKKKTQGGRSRGEKKPVVVKPAGKLMKHSKPSCLTKDEVVQMKRIAKDDKIAIRDMEKAKRAAKKGAEAGEPPLSVRAIPVTSKPVQNSPTRNAAKAASAAVGGVSRKAAANRKLPLMQEKKKAQVPTRKADPVGSRPAVKLNGNAKNMDDYRAREKLRRQAAMKKRRARR